MSKFAWEDIDPKCVPVFQSLINACEAKGFTVVPYFGMRTLAQQAKLWRQSRSTNIVNERIQLLRAENCDYLADAIENAGPQPTKPWATNAIPGLSWHNWGQAMDCYIVGPDGQPNWDGDAYAPYGELAKSMNLRWGGDFMAKDPVHVQLSQQEIPQLYTMQYVNDYFRERNAD